MRGVLQVAQGALKFKNGSPCAHVCSVVVTLDALTQFQDLFLSNCAFLPKVHGKATAKCTKSYEVRTKMPKSAQKCIAEMA